MPSFSDSIFLFILALLLFGPKKLPVLARELGKWVGEFRRASNEFKMQMEEELRLSEQEERTKQIAAMEAAAPLPAVPGEPEEPEHPHMPPPVHAPAEPTITAEVTELFPAEMPGHASSELSAAEPLPIAAAGDLRIMPPSTGLPTPRGRYSGEPEPERRSAEAVNGLFSSVPPENGTRGHNLAEINESAPTH